MNDPNRSDSTVVRPGTIITVHRHKWPDRPHYRNEVTVLGEDDLGVWFGMRIGDPVFRGDEFAYAARADIVGVLPHRHPWTVRWYEVRPGGYAIELYCDVSSPMSWEGTVVTTVDLDFDVVRTLEGETQLLDADEFELHRTKYRYPPDLVVAARTTADLLVEMVSSRAYPFDGAHRRWVEMWSESWSGQFGTRS